MYMKVQIQPAKSETSNILFSSGSQSGTFAFIRLLFWPLRNDLFRSHTHTHTWWKLLEELHLSVVVFVSSLSPVWSGEERVFCSQPRPLRTTLTALRGTGPGRRESKTTGADWWDRERDSGRGENETKWGKLRDGNKYRGLWRHERIKTKRSRDLGGERQRGKKGRCRQKKVCEEFSDFFCLRWLSVIRELCFCKAVPMFPFLQWTALTHIQQLSQEWYASKLGTPIASLLEVFF